MDTICGLITAGLDLPKAAALEDLSNKDLLE